MYYYSSSDWQFEFYLYSNNPNINSESTTNLEIALSRLLNCLHLHNGLTNTIDYYIEIRKKSSDTNSQYIKQGIIFWEDGYIVRKLNFNDSFKTIYSPYDLSIFDKTYLSLSYSNLINKYKQTTQPIPVQPIQVQPIPVQPIQVQPNPVQSNPVQSNPVQSNPVQPNPVQPISNFKQINKLLDETNNILKSSNNQHLEEPHSDTDDESVSSEQLRELEENLDRMMNEQK